MNWTRSLLRLLLGRRLPKTAGSGAVPGITARVTVRRDRWGIPVVEAANDPDAWFGLGFCHGQDRAAQMDFFRRAANGTPSELVGQDGLAIDRLARRIGFRRSAEQQLPALAADVRAVVDAYTRGVTAGLTAGLPRKPHEFALLGGRPQPWSAADVASLGLGNNTNPIVIVGTATGGGQWFVNNNQNQSRPITISGVGWAEGGGSFGAFRARSTISGQITLAGNARIGTNNGATLSGKITGPFELALDGNGANTITISGTTNDYTGGTRIERGMIIVGAANALPTGVVSQFGGTGGTPVPPN